jgi:two-component sensor histidine kinase
MFMLACVQALPFVLVVAFEIGQIWKTERAKQVTELHDAAEEIAAGFNTLLTGYIESLKTLASSPSLQDGNYRSAYDQIRAAPIAPGNNPEISFFLREPGGRQLFNTGRIWGASLPPRSSKIDEEELKEKGFYISGIERSPVTGREIIEVSVGVPGPGEPSLLLSLSIDREVTDNLLKKLRAERMKARDRVFPDDGLVAEIVYVKVKREAGPDPDKGGDPLFRIAPIMLADWGVQTYQINANRRLWLSLRQTLQRHAPVAALIAFLSAAGAWILGRFISSSIIELTRAAAELGAGSEVRFAPSRVREANIVGKALQEAAALRHEAERRRRRELSHRLHNLLIVVHDIGLQIADSSLDERSRAAFEERFTPRLQALTRAHDVLIDASDVPSLRDILESQLGPFLPTGERLALNGPDLVLSRSIALDLGMVFHELATNAFKYGALNRTVPKGRVDVAWAIEPGPDEAQTFRIDWVESKGSPVEPPSRYGFGHSTLVEHMQPHSKEVALEFKPDGIVWRFRCPFGTAVRWARNEASAAWRQDGRVPGLADGRPPRP